MRTLITDLNKDEILRYLGYRGTEIPDALHQTIDRCIELTLHTITPRYLYQKFPLTHTSNGILVGEHLLLSGKDIAAHLYNCKEAYLLCATIGFPIEKLIRLKMVSAPEEGVILDSCASTAIEALADYAEKEIEKEVFEQGYHLTWRFSPGYGDLPLSLQKDFLDMMKSFAKIGLSLNESLLLTPNKSITAILGVSDVKKDTRSNKCDYCNNRSHCTFRKKGSQC